MSFIEYPINVNKINVDNRKFSLYEPGGFAKIRPCAEEYGDKTYLGLFLGEIPNSAYVTYNTETEELNVGLHGNPAIFVFELNKIIYGYESWWSRIENEEDLKDITDADINNVWYVKALKSLSEQSTKKNNN